ncbi:hypothetical protein AB9M62_21585 [Bacillales bacterium AN1005]
MTFADVLSEYIINYRVNYNPVTDINITLARLTTLIRNSSLETYLQENSELINCFINGRYTYKTINNIKVSVIIDFYQFLQQLAPYKQKIVIDKINMRVSKIIIEINDDYLPF